MMLIMITDTKYNSRKDQRRSPANRKKRWLETGLEKGHYITACVKQEAYPEIGISQHFAT